MQNAFEREYFNRRLWFQEVDLFPFIYTLTIGKLEKKMFQVNETINSGTVRYGTRSRDRTGNGKLCTFWLIWRPLQSNNKNHIGSNWFWAKTAFFAESLSTHLFQWCLSGPLTQTLTHIKNTKSTENHWTRTIDTIETNFVCRCFLFDKATKFTTGTKWEPEKKIEKLYCIFHFEWTEPHLHERSLHHFHYVHGIESSANIIFYCW